MATTTAGMKVKYCVEATAGTRPTTGYTEITGVSALPAFGDSINTTDVTPLNATKNKVYVEGLADSGGAIQLTVFDDDTVATAWETCVTAYGALTGGKQMWFEFAYPSGTGMDSFYFPAKPIARGFGGASVDSALENNLNVLPLGDYTFATAST